jgi:hypothetical protein
MLTALARRWKPPACKTNNAEDGSLAVLVALGLVQLFAIIDELRVTARLRDGTEYGVDDSGAQASQVDRYVAAIQTHR